MPPRTWGFGTCPSVVSNEARLELVLAAMDLVAWTKALCRE
ncbi:MAG: hypothetical protein WAV54_10625 [Acidimicrobiales bacterium]